MSLLVLKYFITRKEKFFISKRPSNVLFTKQHQCKNKPFHFMFSLLQKARFIMYINKSVTTYGDLCTCEDAS